MAVLLCSEINLERFKQLPGRYGLTVELVGLHDEIPGSFWKDTEAGLIGDTLYIRHDTPVHSALHESCHYICMDSQRRQQLHTDAGGTALEESAVCYLQILLAKEIPELGQQRILQDMDEWGYSYRLGSAQAWFEQDAEDAYEWLVRHRLITEDGKPTWAVRSK